MARWIEFSFLVGLYFKGRVALVTSKRRALIEFRKSAFHIRKAITMMQDKKYYLEIIRESGIAQDALKRANKEILSYRLETCVRKLLKNKDERGQSKEIITVFRIWHKHYD